MGKEIPTAIPENQTATVQALEPIVVVDLNPKSCDVDHMRRRQRDVAIRYNTLLKAQNELDIAYGRDPETVDKSLTDALEGFSMLPFDAKKQKIAELQVIIPKRIESTFVSNLALHDEILTKTNGGATDKTTKDREDKRKEFYNKSSLGNKLILALHIKAQAEELLLERFDFFVEQLRSYMTTLEATAKEIADEISPLKDKFEKTQKRVGKVGIAKTLKEKVDAVSKTAFRSTLKFYRRQRLERGITEDSADFPSPESLQEQYDNSSYRKKQKVIDTVQDRYFKLLGS